VKQKTGSLVHIRQKEKIAQELAVNGLYSFFLPLSEFFQMCTRGTLFSFVKEKKYIHERILAKTIDTSKTFSPTCRL
jgi:hypothetical protein